MGESLFPQHVNHCSRQLIRRHDPEIERQIIELSIAHRVLTQLTAFVAVDRSRVTRGGQAVRVAVPVEVPDAVAGIATGGSYGYGMSGYGVGGGSVGGVGWGTIGAGHYGTIGRGSGTGVAYGDVQSNVAGDMSGASGAFRKFFAKRGSRGLCLRESALAPSAGSSKVSRIPGQIGCVRSTALVFFPEAAVLTTTANQSVVLRITNSW